MADIALAQGAAEPAAEQLYEFGAAYEQSAELRTLLESPAVSVEATVAQLSAEIARRILQVPPLPGAPAREAR